MVLAYGSDINSTLSAEGDLGNHCGVLGPFHPLCRIPRQRPWLLPPSLGPFWQAGDDGPLVCGSVGSMCSLTST